MLRPSCSTLAAILVFLGLISLEVCAEPTNIRNTTSSVPPVSYKPSTCAATRINYITHTLPQQCLRTGWLIEPGVNANKDGSTLTSQPTGTWQQPSGTKTGANGDIVPTVLEAGFSATTPSLNDRELPNQRIEPEQENDNDPLSDHANFLSFEEWKKQVLEKAGQSPDQVGTPRAGSANGEPRRRPGNINNALDSLGEDSELELDFSGFANPDVTADAAISSQSAGAIMKNGDGKQETATGRLSSKSKDAGKTCKERFNYASFDCAATVLKTNPECKGSTSVLVENKDSYMLNECSASNKFFITELCNDILIDTIVLGNFEFFSSTFRTFRASVSDRYPVKLDKWRDLGTFEARNTREVQAFLVENPLIWARYLRIEFLTHYGNEYYCPVSLLRVHGKTMMDDYRHDVKIARGEEDADDDVSEIGDDVGDDPHSDAIIVEALPREPQPLTEQKDTRLDAPSTITNSSESLLKRNNTNPHEEFGSQTGWLTYRNVLFEQQQLQTCTCSAKRSFCDVEFVELLKKITPEISSLPAKDTGTSISSSIPSSSPVGAPSGKPIPSQPSTSSAAFKTVSSGTQITSNKTEENLIPTDTQGTKISNSQSSQVVYKTSSHPPSAVPTTQESFFKSIHKRLQLLESNSTLSLQYIEEQSRILREAFTKVEKRQLAKTTSFLETLNTTVLNELRDFRLQYDQIWQSTVLELSSQREQSQREVVALSARLSILADETLLHKRMVIVQFFLILLCLGLVIFSRASTTTANPTYLEMQSAVQNMVSKPSTSFSRYLHLDSPPRSPSRSGSRYGLFSRTMNHIRGPSEVSILDSEGRKSPSPAFEYSPPTPTSQPSGDGEHIAERRASLDVKGSVRRIVSSPELQGGNHAEEEEEEDADADADSAEEDEMPKDSTLSEETAKTWKDSSPDTESTSSGIDDYPRDTIDYGA